jgi:hypothetical protein
MHTHPTFIRFWQIGNTAERVKFEKKVAPPPSINVCWKLCSKPAFIDGEVYSFQNKITQTRNVRCFCRLTKISYFIEERNGR